MFESATATVLSDAERNELETLARAGTTTQRLAARSRIMLLAEQGLPNRAIARQVGVSRPTVLAVRHAFASGGVEALRHDRQRVRKRRKLIAELEQKLIDTTLQTKPLGATHWSTRTLAKHLGVSHMTVQRAWQSRELQPHRVAHFKLSNDPHFEAKVRDVVGLYLNPPDRALVLCVDEKSQIQALDRTAPLLPLRPGLPERRTHDYKRHGTTTLFAAFDILSGKVIGQCAPRHRGKEFVKFLNQLEQEVPPELDVHLIMDNYSVHKSPPVQRWLKPKKRQRFHFHFTPTGSSWLNQVERWFAEITNKRIRRGTFDSVAALEKAIYEYLAAWNENPKSFTWRATADIILAKVERCKELSVTGH
jgi:transposase/DNA-binding CsgD family transcriptional regulator